MIAVRKKKNGFGAMLAASTVAHLILYFSLTYFYFPHEMKVTEQICYVDMVNLPVESPRQGAPAPPAAETAPPAPSTVPPEPALPKQPAKTAQQQKTAATLPVPGKGPAAKKPAETEASTDDFQKRIAQMQEEREYEKRMEALRKRTEAARPASATGPAGMPTGTGTQSGSDYMSYIHSRLKDAFAQTMTVGGKTPEAVVQLSIDRFGNVSGIRFEKISGDKLFDDSVMRAIALAKKNFPAPPGGNEFRANFIFRPQGVRPEGVGKK